MQLWLWHCNSGMSVSKEDSDSGPKGQMQLTSSVQRYKGILLEYDLYYIL